MVQVGCIGSQETRTWLVDNLPENQFSVKAPQSLQDFSRSQEQGIDVVIIDQAVDQNVIDFIKNSGIPCLPLVSKVDSSTLTALREGGAAGCLLKNNTPQEVKFRVEAVLKEKTSIRKNVRKIIRIKVEYRIGNENFEGQSYTLSAQGIYILSANPPAPKTDMFVRFRFKEGGPLISCSGQVAYTVKEGNESAYPPGMAVVFSRITESDKERIDTFLSQHVA